MTIMEQKEGIPCDKLDPRARANMERCANFLVRMVEKYGKEVLAEIEAEEHATMAEKPPEPETDEE